MSEPSVADENDSSPPSEANDRGGDHPPPRKRQRVRLSCLECRRRKLSCDREFPCSRCLQSGTPDRCEYETRAGLAPANRLGFSQNPLFDTRLSLPPGVAAGADSLLYRKDALREHDRIRKLELEVAQLKNIIAKQVSLDGSTEVDNSQTHHQKPEPRQPEVEPNLPSFIQYQQDLCDKEELRFFRGKEFKTRYFGPHSTYHAFAELTGLSPFMKETAEEWLRPLHIHHKKDRGKDREEREKKFLMPDPELEALLPSKEETDSLVSVYLDQFEQVHRIIHIPSFRCEYAKFWDHNGTRYAAFTALVLSIMAISSCLHESPPAKFEKMISISHTTALRWIKACEEWQGRQSQKHRRLIHYQICCLLYLGRRVNTMKKKRFWIGAGAITQDAVSVGLHREPSLLFSKISPFNQEMRRRLWATIQNFDLQASFDHGLPSLLSTLHCDVDPPRNIDDEDFDEDTEELPPSKPKDQYTYSSFQNLCRQSLPLRLQLGRVLTGPPGDLDYDKVILLTNEINQEIDSLPSWDISDRKDTEGLKMPLLAYTLLHIQLRQYIIPLHQPYLRLRKTNSKYQYSEIIYYNATRDMVLLNDKLVQQGVRTLNFLREDNLTLAINLCNVTMLQPRGSTNMIMINSQHTRELLEKCLAMKEDRILRCGNNEPWGYSIMCAAVGLLEAHLGVRAPESAKAAAAERFVNLHLKLIAGQDPPLSSQQSDNPKFPPPYNPLGGALAAAAVPSASQLTAASANVPQPVPSDIFCRSKSVTPFPSASQGSATQVATGLVEVPGTPWWIPPSSSDPNNLAVQMQPPGDFSLEMLGLININELWGSQWDWESQ